MIYGGALLLGYILGSIPFGLVLCKIFGYGDIRKIGSGNIGATNVLRTGNKLLAFLTLILDSGKGAIAVFLVPAILVSAMGVGEGLGSCFNNETGERELCSVAVIDTTLNNTITALATGLGAVIGHCFPIWLKFKGGKGVATTLGTLLAAVPVAGVIACLTWLCSALVGRISSLAAISAMIVVPFATYWFYSTQAALIVLGISALVIVKHHENIRRILKGEEPKIGQKKKGEKK